MIIACAGSFGRAFAPPPSRASNTSDSRSSRSSARSRSRASASACSVAALSRTAARQAKPALLPCAIALRAPPRSCGSSSSSRCATAIPRATSAPAVASLPASAAAPRSNRARTMARARSSAAFSSATPTPASLTRIAGLRNCSAVPTASPPLAMTPFSPPDVAGTAGASRPAGTMLAAGVVLTAAPGLTGADSAAASLLTAFGASGPVARISISSPNCTPSAMSATVLRAFASRPRAAMRTSAARVFSDPASNAAGRA